MRPKTHFPLGNSLQNGNANASHRSNTSRTYTVGNPKLPPHRPSRAHQVVVNSGLGLHSLARPRQQFPGHPTSGKKPWDSRTFSPKRRLYVWVLFSLGVRSSLRFSLPLGDTSPQPWGSLTPHLFVPRPQNHHHHFTQTSFFLFLHAPPPGLSGSIPPSLVI